MKSDNYGLKKAHPFRLVGGVQTQTGWTHIHMCWIKIWEGYLGSKGSLPTAGTPAEGSRARKISPHNIWMQNPAEIE